MMWHEVNLVFCTYELMIQIKSHFIDSNIYPENWQGPAETDRPTYYLSTTTRLERDLNGEIKVGNISQL